MLSSTEFNFRNLKDDENFVIVPENNILTKEEHTELLNSKH